jgi:hypothetical protein
VPNCFQSALIPLLKSSLKSIFGIDVFVGVSATGRSAGAEVTVAGSGAFVAVGGSGALVAVGGSGAFVAVAGAFNVAATAVDVAFTTAWVCTRAFWVPNIP